MEEIMDNTRGGAVTRGTVRSLMYTTLITLGGTDESVTVTLVTAGWLVNIGSFNLNEHR